MADVHLLGQVWAGVVDNYGLRSADARYTKAIVGAKLGGASGEPIASQTSSVANTAIPPASTTATWNKIPSPTSLPSPLPISH